MKWHNIACMAGLLAISVSMANAETSGAPLSFGIVPQQSPGKLAQMWTPLLKYLEAKTGLSLQFETAKNVGTFNKRAMAGEYDIIYVNPLIYVAALHKSLGYEAFAREKDRSLVGLLLVSKGSSYRTAADLAGSDLAFPAEAAMAASVIPRAYLDKQAIAFTPHYVGSHESVYLAVAKGLYAGGGGVERTFEMMPGPVKDQLRVLWTSPEYPPHPFAAHPRVPADVVRRLQAALVAMDSDKAGQAILQPLAISGFMPARDADYKAVLSLNYKLPGR